MRGRGGSEQVVRRKWGQERIPPFILPLLASLARTLPSAFSRTGRGQIGSSWLQHHAIQEPIKLHNFSLILGLKHYEIQLNTT